METTGLLCGGSAGRREGSVGSNNKCFQWSPDSGSWEELLTLDIYRIDHLSWTPGNGIGTYLMGGGNKENKNTTTLIKPDGTQELGFTLKYDIR